jgi:hypothetical protein
MEKMEPHEIRAHVRLLDKDIKNLCLLKKDNNGQGG